MSLTFIVGVMGGGGMKNPKPEKIERADEPGISKLEYRRRLLKQRDQEWAALLLTKPDMVSLSQLCALVQIPSMNMGCIHANMYQSSCNHCLIFHTLK